MCTLTSYKVFKSNKLVQAKSAFSSIEHKIILLAMVQIQPTDEELKMYQINIQDILGKNHTSHYDLVRKSVKRLHKSVIEMENEKGWITYAFITKAQGEFGKNYVEIQFHRDIQQFLLGLKSHYTSYTLNNVISFKKNYSLRIYELCKQYQKIGERLLDIEYLRTIFSLEGKYKDFHLFKKRVIESSVEEINQYSDLFLRFKEVKSGRKVASIIFTISKNNLILDESQLKTLAEIDLGQKLKNRLLRAGFTYEEVKLLQEKYSEDRIESVLILCDKFIDDIHHPKAWINKTLQVYVDKTDYRDLLEKERLDEKKRREKKRDLDQKMMEVYRLEQHIEQDKKDIKEYQETNKLRLGDRAVRFKGKNVKEAINILEDRVFESEMLIKKVQRDLRDLHEPF